MTLLKTTASAVALMAATSIASAGGMADPIVAMAPDDIVAAAPAGSSSGDVIVPLIFIALIAMAVTNDGGGGGIPFSDATLKSNITQVGQSASGLPIYEFQYTGYKTIFRGVMAQDVLMHTPDAVHTMTSGHLGVDYSKIDVDFTIAH